MEHDKLQLASASPDLLKNLADELCNLFVYASKTNSSLLLCFLVVPPSTRGWGVARSFFYCFSSTSIPTTHIVTHFPIDGQLHTVLPRQDKWNAVWQQLHLLFFSRVKLPTSEPRLTAYFCSLCAARHILALELLCWVVKNSIIDSIGGGGGFELRGDGLFFFPYKNLIDGGLSRSARVSFVCKIVSNVIQRKDHISYCVSCVHRTLSKKKTLELM